MRKFLLILILALSFQTLTKADDIRDFEIEGISLGDSLLDHYSEKIIKANTKALDIYKPFGWTTFSTKTQELKSELKNYKHIQIEYILNDKNYIVQGVSGKVKLDNFTLNKCKKKASKISSEIEKVVGINLTFQHDKDTITSSDKSGKSIDDVRFYIFDNQSFISVRCVDWSTEVKYQDNLSVNVVSLKYRQMMEKAHPHKY